MNWHKRDIEKSCLPSRDARAFLHCIMCSQVIDISTVDKSYVDFMTNLNVIKNLSKCNIAIEWDAFERSINKMLAALMSLKGRRYGLCVRSPLRALFIRCLAMMTQTGPSHYLNQCWNIDNWTFWTNFREILVKICIFSFKETHSKMSSRK